MRRAARLLAIVMILLGGVWILQGANLLSGSQMSGDPFWGWIGAIVLVAGFVIGGASVRASRGKDRA